MPPKNNLKDRVKKVVQVRTEVIFITIILQQPNLIENFYH